jgi:hypothetical protein
MKVQKTNYKMMSAHKKYKIFLKIILKNMVNKNEFRFFRAR